MLRSVVLKEKAAEPDLQVNAEMYNLQLRSRLWRTLFRSTSFLCDPKQTFPCETITRYQDGGIRTAARIGAGRHKSRSSSLYSSPKCPDRLVDTLGLLSILRE